jgi:hypothetical protein
MTINLKGIEALIKHERLLTVAIGLGVGIALAIIGYLLHWISSYRSLHEHLRRLIKKSSIFFAFFRAATNHLGCAPLPAQVLPCRSRYLTGTFRPLAVLPRMTLENVEMYVWTTRVIWRI